MNIVELRKQYHNAILAKIVRIQPGQNEYPNFADKANKASRQIAWGIVNRLGTFSLEAGLKGQTTGGRFEVITANFLEQAFALINHLRPGRWQYSTNIPISKYSQYEHLADFENAIRGDRRLASSLGRDYIITPDIVVGRWPVSDDEINKFDQVIFPSDDMAKLTPFRDVGEQYSKLILHASISCKWTLRSDRGQNARTEALNLIRNRKGNLPHIMAVTAEPLPTRISSLALGTGDLDCVYHFALNELMQTLDEIKNEDQKDMLEMLIDGKRLRDISDLPFDLAI